MNVTISVKSRFHAFYLASELNQRGFLRRLVTTYPAFEAAKYGVPRARVSSMVWLEIVDRIIRRWRRQSPYSLLTSFDRQASLRIPRDTDIFVAWSACAEESIRRARELGIATVVERGSTHIDTQVALLKEEHDRLGIAPASSVDQRILEKERREYEIADAISIPSSHVEQSFLERGFDPSKLIRTPYGVDLSHFLPGRKEDSIFRIICCGALSIRKGILYLLEAFSALKLPHCELWLIGAVTEEIKPFLQRYLSSNIRVMGPFPEFQLQEYYAQGSVFCLMSLEEGMAMTPLQAMACGLPVILTNYTGGEDVVHDAVEGFIIAPRDTENLKEKIVFLYENPEIRKTMGQAARENVVSNYTWHHYGERMADQYKRLLARVKNVCGCE